MTKTIALIFSLPLTLAAGCNPPVIGGDGDGGSDSGNFCIGRGCQINYNCPAAQGSISVTIAFDYSCTPIDPLAPHTLAPVCDPTSGDVECDDFPVPAMTTSWGRLKMMYH